MTEEWWGRTVEHYTMSNNTYVGKPWLRILSIALECSS